MLQWTLSFNSNDNLRQFAHLWWCCTRAQINCDKLIKF